MHEAPPQTISLHTWKSSLHAQVFPWPGNFFLTLFPILNPLFHSVSERSDALFNSWAAIFSAELLNLCPETGLFQLFRLIYHLAQASLD